MLNRWLAASRLTLIPCATEVVRPLWRATADPALWQGERRPLCGAVAAGLFASWVPMPMHSLVAVAWCWRSASTCRWPLGGLVQQPADAPFMYLYAYRTGCLVLNETPAPFHLTWSLHWLEQGRPPWCPFLLGSLLLAVLSAAAGALLTLLLLQLGKLARPR